MLQRFSKNILQTTVIVLSMLGAALPTFADSNQYITYQGRILKPDGLPLEGNIEFLVKIYSPAPAKCLLWAEKQTLNMTGSMGAFSLEIGKDAHRVSGGNGGGALSFNQAFVNHPNVVVTSGSALCNPGYTAYTANYTDERILSVTFSDQGQQIRVVDQPIKSVPFAMQAEQISGYSINYLVKVAGPGQPGDKVTSIFSKDSVDLLWELSENKDFQGNRLKNIGAPAAPTDAATKAYVDSLLTSSGSTALSNLTGDANVVVTGTGATRSLSLGTMGSAGTYGSAGSSGVYVPTLTVDAWGRITLAGQSQVPVASGTTFGLLAVNATNGLTLTGGTLGLLLNNLSGSNFAPQNANSVFAGPISGSLGTATFRSLVQADIPILSDAGKVSNSATTATALNTAGAIVARGTTGGFAANSATLNYLAFDNGLGVGNSIILQAPVGLSPYTLTLPAGTGLSDDLLAYDGAGNLFWKSANSLAGMTSLQMIVPNAEMSVSAPVGPGAGTLTISWNSQNANSFFAAPTGGSGLPTFRAMVAADIPNLDAAKITTGTLPVSRGGTGLNATGATAGQLLIATGSAGFSLGNIFAGSGVVVTNGAGSIGISFDPFSIGGVTHVGLAAPTSVFSISGSAVTSVGTLGLTFNNQAGGSIFAAPTGSTGQPGFRAMVASDVPNLDASKITSGSFSVGQIPDLDASKITSGTFGVNRGGTGLVPTVANANQLYTVNGAGDGAEFKTLVQGTGILINTNSGTISISAVGSSGTVSNIGAVVPSYMSVSPAAISSAGTFDFSFNSQGANQVFAAPTGGTGAPGFRFLVSSDLPDLDAAKITSGTLPVSRGGTGLNGSSAANGQLLIGNGSGFSLGSITGGSGVNITNNAGSIGIAFDPLTGGVVTNVGLTAPTSIFSVSGSAVTGAGTLGLTLNSQAANLIFAAPTGGTGTPNFRSLVALDIPDLDAAKITSGTLGILRIPDLDAAKITSGTLATTRGGTGLDGSSAANGQLLIGNGSGFALGSIIGGSGVQITNNAGSIGIAFDSSAAGVVTNIGATVPSYMSVSPGAISSYGTFDFSFNSQAANLVFAAPTGGSGAPGFRSLAPSDIPSLDAAKITTGTLPVSLGGTGLNASSASNGQLLIGNGTGFALGSIIGGSGVQITNDSGSIAISFSPSGAGVVTNVGLTAPTSIFSVSGSAVTGAGTLGLSLNSQTANMVFAAPTGGAGAPEFRVLEPSDIPNLSTIKLTSGTLGTDRGGTGLVPAAGNANQLYAVNGAGDGAEFKTLIQGSGVTINNTAGTISISATGLGGTVFNIGAAVPSYMSVSPSAITSSGTFDFGFNTQAANLVFAAPTGGTGAPDFRALAASDIPNLDAAKITSGTLDILRIPDLDASKITSGTLVTSRGGTGLDASSASNGQLLIGNGAGFSLGSLSGGSGVQITNNSGSIAISFSPSGAGVVTNVGLTAPTSIFSVSGSAVTGAGTLGLSLNSQTANMVFAAPTGGAGAPEFRVLEPSDIPNLSTIKLTSGTLGTDRGGTGLVPAAGNANQLYAVNGAGDGAEFKTLIQGSGVTINNTAGTISISATGLGGTVFNIGAAVPSYMSVSPSAITSSGTFDFNFNTQAANMVFAAPTGGTGAPAFRALAASDIPSLDASKITTGTLPVSLGGTGLNASSASNGQLLIGNGAGFSLGSLSGGSGVQITNNSGSIGISFSPSGAGVVTNVGLTAPTSVFNVSGSAVTGAGTLGLTFNSQTAAFVFAAPTGSAGTPDFRALAATDIPSLDASKITTGTLPVSLGGTGLDASSASNGQLLIGNGTGFALGSIIGGSGVQITNNSGSIAISFSPSGAGVVTNVGLTAPTSIFSVSGSAVTGAGTLGLSLNSQTANMVFAAPTGGAGAPEFRVLEPSDIPNLSTIKLTSGTLGTDRGGTGLVPAAGNANQLYAVNGAGDGAEFKTLIQGSGVTINNTAGTISISATGLGGTVFNIGAAVPSYMSVSPSAITSSGTFDFGFNTQAANLVFAAPTGGTGAPDFRALAASDIPSLNASKITTGTLPVSLGGTGLDASSASNGQLLIGNGTGFALGSISGGSGVQITNNSGSIGISFSPSGAGVVTNVGLTAPTSVFNVSGSAVTGAGTLGLTFNSQTAAFVFAAPTGSAGTPEFRALAATDIPSLDASKITTGTLPVSLGGTGLDASSASNGQLLIGNGTGFALGSISGGSGVQITNNSGSIAISFSPSGAGVVTNVGLTAPTSIFSVSGSAVTGAGTLGLSLNSQTANMVFAAPTGGAGAPEFRVLEPSDIPNLSTTKLTSGTLGTDRGGTGLVPAAGNANQLYAVNGAGDGAEFKTLIQGSGVTINNTAGTISISATGLGGTVFNIGAAVPSYMSVSPSAITSSGTFDFNFNNQTANMVFAAPTGGTGAPAFRALAASDIPSLDASKITTGTLPVSLGGTGLNASSASNGQLLIGNGTGFALGSISGGSGVQITNNSGSIGISFSPSGAGVVTNVGATVPAYMSVSPGAISSYGTFDFNFNTQAANMVFAAPTGGTGAPAFRALAALDIPSLDTSKITTGTLPVSLGGTGLNASSASNGQLLIGNGTGFTLGSISGGSGVQITNNSGSIGISFSPSGAGVVTNVGLTAPTSVFNVSGSAVTGAGTLGLTFNSQTAAFVFAAPTGSAGTPDFRALAATDIPSLDASKIGSGTLGVNRGGTGLDASSAANGQFLIGNGSGFALGSIIGGSGVQITNYAGSLGIAFDPAAGGVVTNVGLSAPTSVFTVSGSAVTGAGTLGLSLNQQAAMTFFAAPTGASGAPSFRLMAATDIPSLDAAKIGSGTLGTNRGGTGLDASAASNGQILIGNGSGFSLNTLTAGTGISITNSAGTINIANSLATSGWVQNGNSFAQTGTLGTNDNYDLAFETNNTTRMTINSGGSVGIGTTTPLYTFDVLGNLRATMTSSGNITYTLAAQNAATPAADNGAGLSLRGGSGAGTSMATVAAGWNAASNQNAYLALSTITSGSVTEKVRVTSAGNVGVGTIAPSGILDLTATGTNSALVLPRATTANRPTALDGMIRYNTDLAKFEARENGAWVNMISAGTGTFWAQGGNSFAQTGTLGTSDANALAIKTNDATRLFISSGGSIGVGTTAPSSILHVAGDLTVDANNYLVMGPGTRMKRDTTNNGLSLQTSSTDRLFIADNGYVGIGTTSPSGPLHLLTNANGSGGGAIIRNMSAGNVAAGYLDIENDTGARLKIGVSSSGNTQYTGIPASRAFLHGSSVVFGASNAGGSLSFLTGGLASSNERLRIDSSGNIGVGTAAPSGIMDLTATGTNSALVLPRATTANRPTAIDGMIRYNTDLAKFEARENGAWVNMIGAGSLSIGLTAPTTIFSITGSPVTGVGTFSMDFQNQVGATVFAAPTGSTGAPTFRALASTDIPSLDASKIGSGTLGTNRGGTGLDASAASNGQLLIGNGSGFSLNTLTAGTGISITNSAGTINIANSLATFGWVQNGNSFAQTGTLGTNDNYNLAFETNNTTRMTITNGGSVGIGTASPTAKLHVYNNNGGGISNLLLLENGVTAASGNGTSVEFSFPSSVRSGIIQSVFDDNSNNASMRFSTMSTGGIGERVRITATGNMGIGTSTPSEILHVYRSSNSTNGIVAENPTNGGTSVSAFIAQSNSAGVSTQFGMTASGYTQNTAIPGGAGYMWSKGGGGISLVASHASGVILFSTGGTTSTDERMRINAAGNVGIGTTAPSGILDLTATGTNSALVLPRATTANRPTAIDGMIRYNTDLAKFEARENGAWVNMIGAGSLSIGLTAPTTIFSITGSPVTSNGTFAMGFQDQIAATVFAAPTGSTGAPTFRALASTDIPSLDASKIGSGTLGTNRGGTGLDASAASNGQLLIGNGSGFSLNTLTAGTGIAITNSAGTINISNTFASSSWMQGGNSFAQTGTLGTSDNYDLTFKTNNTTRMVIASSGNIGIGTTAPSEQLQVSRSSGSLYAAWSTAQAFPWGAPGLAPVLSIENTSSTNTTGAFIELSAKTTAGNRQTSYIGAVANSLSTYSPDLVFGVRNGANSYEERMSLAYGGRLTVGIGSGNGGSVAVRSNITGPSFVADNHTSSATSPAAIDLTKYRASNTISSGDQVSQISSLGRVSGSNLEFSMIRTTATTATTGAYTGLFSIRVADAGAVSERLSIAGSNVGIGTTAPSGILDLTATGTNSALVLPRATTANRPTAIDGMIRYNTDLAKFEARENGAWVNMISAGTGTFWAQGGNSFGQTGTLGTSDANDMIIKTNNTTRMYFSSGGTVGIGTATPSYPFEVVSANGNTGQAFSNHYAGNNEKGMTLRAVNTGGVGGAGLGSSILLEAENGSSAIRDQAKISSIWTNSTASSETADFKIETSSAGTMSERFRITGAGNVGIGTTGPAVYGGFGPTIEAKGGYGATFQSTASDGTTKGGFYADSNLGFVAFGSFAGSNVPTVINASGSEKARIDTSGNMGIGTSAPSGILDLTATGTNSALVLPRATTANRPTAIDGMIRYNTDLAKFEARENGAWVNMISAGTGTGAFWSQGGNSFGQTGTLGTSDGNDLAIKTNNTTRLFVTSGGSVGIGTTTPGLKVDVRGTNAKATTSALENLFQIGSTDASPLVLRAGIKTDASVGNRYASIDVDDAGTKRTLVLQPGGGDVAIGTTSGTSARLHIAGSSSALVRLENTGGLGAEIMAQDTSGGALGGINFGSNNLSMINQKSGDLIFYTNNTAYARILGTNGNFGIGTPAPSGILDLTATGTNSALVLPRATTANRPTAIDGMIRYNTDLAKFEARENGAWLNMIPATSGTGALWAQGGNSFGQTGTLGTNDANALAIETNNTTRMFISSGGSVGIGTTSPAVPFEVRRADNGEVARFVNTSWSGFPIRFSAVDGEIAQNGNFHMTIDADNNDTDRAFTIRKNVPYMDGGTPTELFRVQENGNVGVGTAAPSGIMDLTATGTNSALVLPRATTANRPTAIDGMIRYNTDLAKFEARENGAWVNMIAATSGTGALWAQGGNSFGQTGTLGTSDAYDLAIKTNNTTRLFINSGGSVGIGTTNPGNPLTVGSQSGQSNANISARAGSGNSFEWGHSNTGGYGSTLGYNQGGGQPFLCFNCEAGTTVNTYRTRGLAGALIKSTPAMDGGVTFNSVPTASADNQAATELVRITGSGNVGIGTASPGFSLHVANDTMAAAVLSTSVSSATPSILGFRKSRGTTAAPTANSVGDVIGQIDFNTYNDAYRGSASIRAEVDTGAAATGADVPGRLLFLTTPDGSATAAERMRIDSAGNLAVGTTGAIMKVTLQPSAATDGIQILRQGSGATNASYWGISMTNAAATDTMILGNSSSAYSTGGALTWIGNSNSFLYYPSQLRIGTGVGTMATMVLNSSGLVGIGTNSPSTPLHVVDDSGLANPIRAEGNAADTRIAIMNNAAAAVTNYTGLDLKAMTSTQSRTILNLTANFVNTTDATRTSNVHFMTLSGGNSVEALTLLGGSVGIGAGTPSSLLHVAGSGVPLIRVQDLDSSAGNATSAVEFYDSAGTRTGWVGDPNTTTNIGIGSVSGSVIAMAGANTCTYTSGAAWSCSSDERMKDRIERVPAALDSIAQMRGVKYHWRDAAKSGPEHLGLIAQEVEKVFPQVVETDEDTGLKRVDYSALISPIIEAIKELYAKYLGHEKAISELQEANMAKDKAINDLKQENSEIKAALCAKDPSYSFCPANRR